MVYKKICFLMMTWLLLGNYKIIASIIPDSGSGKCLNFLNKLESNNPEKTTLDLPTKDNISYIFRIKYPESIKKQPNLRAYYKGYKYDIGNMGIINHQTEANTLFIVITDQIKHKCENERIQYLERIENNPCRAFFLSLKVAQNNPESPQWQIVEENIQNIPLRLPEDALVILLSSNMVETIKENANKFVEDFKKNIEYNPNENKRTIVYLPELIIRSNINQSQMDLAAAHASLCGIDLDAMHVSPKKEIKIERERIVELAPFGQNLV